jgi:hypothetical protein
MGAASRRFDRVVVDPVGRTGCWRHDAEAIRHTVSSRSSDTASSRKNVARMIGPATRGRRQPSQGGKRNSGTAAIFSRVVTSAATALVAVPVVAGLSGYLWLGRIYDDPLQRAGAVIVLGGEHDGR